MKSVMIDLEGRALVLDDIRLDLPDESVQLTCGVLKLDLPLNHGGTTKHKKKTVGHVAPVVANKSKKKSGGKKGKTGKQPPGSSSQWKWFRDLTPMGRKFFMTAANLTSGSRPASLTAVATAAGLDSNGIGALLSTASRLGYKYSFHPFIVSGQKGKQWIQVQGQTRSFLKTKLQAMEKAAAKTASQTAAKSAVKTPGKKKAK